MHIYIGKNITPLYFYLLDLHYGVYKNIFESYICLIIQKNERKIQIL